MRNVALITRCKLKYLLTILICIQSAIATATTESEPNDTLLTSNKVVEETLIRGEIDVNQDDQDYYVFGVSENSVLKVSVLNLDSDTDTLYLQLLDANGAEIWSGYNVGYNKPTPIEHIVQDSAVVFLRLYEARTAFWDVPNIPYEISISQFDRSPIHLLSVSNSTGGSSNIEGVSLVTASQTISIEFVADAGYYLDSLSDHCGGQLSGSTLTIANLRADCEIQSSFVELPPPDSDSDGVPDEEDAFPLDPTEQSDFDEDGIGDNSDADDDNDGVSDLLEIEFVTSPYDANDYPQKQETEPNDEFLAADEYTMGIPHMGSLYSHEDLDFFKVEIESGSDLTLNISKKTSDYDYIRYALLNSEEEVFAAAEVYNDERDLKTLGIEEGGTYFLAVGGKDSFNTSNNDYQVLMTIRPLTGLYESEPNNILELADVLSSGKSVTGNLAGLSDLDVYKLQIMRDSILNLQIGKLKADYDYITYALFNTLGDPVVANEIYHDEIDVKTVGIEAAGDYFLVVGGKSAFDTSFSEYEIKAVYSELTISNDADFDGLADETDNCPEVSNVDQLDSDGDGHGDSCDSDDDNDGVDDSVDAFPLNPAETLDTDSDGLGNNEDEDDDGDGLPDGADAYPLVAIGSLLDADNDGAPDDCDQACVDSGMGADADDDNDGVEDGTDAFPLDAAETLDTDGDGVGNNADIDDDGDGYSDAYELETGTDPLDATDFKPSYDDLNGVIYHWSQHSLVNGAEINRIADTEVKAATNAQGQYTFEETPEGNYELSASQAVTDSDTNRTITSADALAALKIAVGLNPNSDPDGDGPLEALAVSPYQLIAADMNQDGRVTSSDALAILKVAVGLSDALEPSWKLVEDSQALWLTHSDKSRVFNASQSYALSYPDQAQANFAAILLGDVNASWKPQEGTESLNHDHFSAYAITSGAPLSLWGIRDSDQDGLSDEQEDVLGTSPFDADTDADGVNDIDDAYPLDPDKSEYVAAGLQADRVLSASPKRNDLNPVTLVNPVLLRGDMNDWGVGDAFTKLEDGSYYLALDLEAGTYTFKIATKDWAMMDLGADDEASRLIVLNKFVTLTADSNASFVLEVNDGSELVFVVEHDSDGTAVLSVSELQ